MKANQDGIKRYGLFNNIAFSLKNIWKWDKGYYLAYIPRIPFAVFLPLAAVYFPKLLIDNIQASASDLILLAVIGGYSLMLVAVGIINLFCESRVGATRSVFTLYYQNLVGHKERTMDYENRENPKVANLCDQTRSGSRSGEDLPNEISLLMINLLGVFTYGGIIAALNPLILVLLIISTAVSYYMMKYVREYNNKNRDKWTHLDRRNQYLYDISYQFEYAKDIKLYNMREWLYRLTVYYQGLRMEWYKKVSNKNYLSGAVDGGLRFIRDGVSYAVLITMLLNNKLNVGDFIFYFGAITGFSGWLSSISKNFNGILTHNNNLDRLRMYLDTEDKFNRGEGISLPTETPYEIELRNLSYRYPGSEKPVINDINFKINKGERLALVGPNGAGKTTLVKLISGLYYPTSGQVLLNGENARTYNIEKYYTQFSVVFQDTFFFPIPISHFVASTCDNISEERVREVLRLAGLYKAVEALPNDIHTTLIKGAAEDSIDLSGGERQKLMLARALYKDTPVIILDEPTAALDPIAENELYMQYAKLTQGKTSIYISHRLSSTRFCDRIAFIQDGKISEYGSHEELIALNGLYAEMYEIQSHYYKSDNIEGGVVNGIQKDN